MPPSDVLEPAPPEGSSSRSRLRFAVAGSAALVALIVFAVILLPRLGGNGTVGQNLPSGSSSNAAGNGGSQGASSSQGAPVCATGSLTAQGSTAQLNAMNEWIKDYQTACSSARIDYQGTGSGAGIASFEAGQADFVGSDSALSGVDVQKANARCGTGNNAIDLPMAVTPTAVVYNLSGVSNLQLSAPTLARIFSGRVVRWNDPAIAADNPGVTLPSTPMLTVHRSDSSGVTDNFTKYLGVAAPSDWTYAHNKVWPAPGGTAQRGSDGISASIKGNDGAIGYVEWSFAQVNSLSMAGIRNNAGEYRALTEQSAAATVSGASITGTGNDLALSVDYNTTQSGAYPIVLVTYEIVCEKGTAADKLALLKAFLTYAAAGGQAAVGALGYAAMPPALASKVQASISNLS
jgi:phosphate transport system substrate-binding protein